MGLEELKDAILGPGAFRTYYPYYILFTISMIIGRYLVSQGVMWYVRKTNPTCKPHHPAKAADSFWFGTYYIVSWLWSWWCLNKGGISYRDVLKDCKALSLVVDPPITWTFYAMYEAAHYTTCMFYYFFDSRQNHTDFFMMLGHHVAVLTVAYLSLRIPSYQAGLMYSLSIHDLADFWMEYAKVLRYLDNPYFYFLYLVLVPAWGIPRCFIFPLTSIKCCILYFPHTVAMGVLILGQVALWIMDCVWWYMILSMLTRALTGTLNKDVRSEDESDEPASERKAQRQTTRNPKANVNPNPTPSRRTTKKTN